MTVTPQSNAPRPAPRPNPVVDGRQDERSIRELVDTVSTNVSVLIRNEVELAKLEVTSSLKNAGIGAGFFIAALVVLFFSLTFGFIAAAEGIAAAGLDRWLAFLIVFGAQLVIVGMLVFLGIRKIKRAKPPQRTIRTSRDTVDALKKARS